jgi:hypothetical protein
MNKEYLKDDPVSKSLFTSIETLELLIDKQGAALLLEIKNHAECTRKRDELRRLYRSLKQYTSTTTALLYVGFLGHFSSGKSSTINSLLDLWDKKTKRLTGLHPTDTVITLTTHPQNSNSLVGMHQRGELEVGSSIIESEWLKHSVVMDTPGTGDPVLVQEMIRDFLPICDRIIYVFSATSPLDATDLPILEKTHQELPFIPIKFIVTRAGEFKRDDDRALSLDNFDQQNAHQFVAELIARISAALPGKTVDESDILLIDNKARFATDKLAEFVFGNRPFDTEIGAVNTLHNHKLKYFADSAKEIREYFLNFIQQQIHSMDTLVTTATSHHQQYQEVVDIALSHLTESWTDQYRLISSTKHELLTIRNDKWDHIPATVSELNAFHHIRSEITDKCDNSIENQLDRFIKSIKEHLTQSWTGRFDAIREQIQNASSIDLINPVLSNNEIAADIFANSSFHWPAKIPKNAIDMLSQMPNHAINEMHEHASRLHSQVKQLQDEIRERLLLTEITKTVEKSQQQIVEMLDRLFNSVNIYKTAVLAINTKEMAERLTLGKVIDDLAKTNISDGQKTTIKNTTLAQIFSDSGAMIHAYEQHHSKLLSDQLVPIASQIHQLTTKTEINTDAADRISRVADLDIKNDAGINMNLTQIGDIYLKHANHGLNKLQQKIGQIVKSARQEFLDDKTQIIKHRHRRLLGSVVVGCALGLLGLLIYFNINLEDENSSIALLASVMTTETVMGMLSWGLAILTDKTKQKLATTLSQSVDEVKKQILNQISIQPPHLDHEWSFVENFRDEIKDQISAIYSTKVNEIIKTEIQPTCSERLTELGALMTRFRSAMDCYTKSSVQLLDKVATYYHETERNLGILTDVSDQIKKTAILPSFHQFQQRHEELKKLLESIQKVEFF